MTQDLFPETQLRPADDPNSRFTTPEMMHWVKMITAAELAICEPWDFDLDPFAHPESHWGKTWWTKADNAYERIWFGKVFVNGPWDECEQVVAKVCGTTWLRGSVEFVAQILPGNRQDQPFWQRLIEPIRDRRDRNGLVVTSHYPPGRTSYGFPGNPLGLGQGSMNVNSLLLVWRRA